MMSRRKDRFNTASMLTFILLAVFIGTREYVLKPASAAASSSLVKDFTDIPLPGASVRFDYQNLDAKSGLLYISHMGDNHVVVFNVHTDKVVANIPDCPGSTGVLYLPQYNHIISSASAAHEVVINRCIRRALGANHPKPRNSFRGLLAISQHRQTPCIVPLPPSKKNRSPHPTLSHKG